MKSRHAKLTSIWHIRPEQKIEHPAPFPIELPTRCIYSILDGKPGNVIDPYAGSGTTLVAAKLLGCNYLGIDIAEGYVRMAGERLRNYGKEWTKVLAELEKHKVMKTFKERKKEGLSVGKFANRKEAEEGKQKRLWEDIEKR